MPELLGLDDPRCRNVELAGGKAAGLSHARSAGLPVLDGVVVPASAARDALNAGADALASRGSGGARRVVMGTALPGRLADALRSAVAALGGDVIVRSSADVEAAGEWAGAFSTFSEIGPQDVGTAVRGCWASVFSVDTIERGERTGREPGDLSVAVVVQPRIDPVASGLARVRPGAVEVVAVEGSPAALLSGWAGGQRVVVQDGSAPHVPPESVLPAHQWQEVAALARRVHDLLGHRVVEWAWTGRSLVLLQTMRGPPAPAEPPIVKPLTQLDDPEADRIAALAVAFPQRAADELIFSWALGVRDATALALTGTAAADPPGEQVLRQAASELAATVWGTGADEAMARTARVLRDLRGDQPGPALQLLADLREPDHAAAERLLSWWRAGLGRTAPPGPGRWEPFLTGVAQTRGQAVLGEAAAGGVGAGCARIVRHPHEPPPQRRPREVIVAATPVPALSSLLWDAAGLVTTGGSAAAHLIDVARSLGVPAVVGCDGLPPWERLAGSLVAVDGDAGAVSHHPLDPVPVS